MKIAFVLLPNRKPKDDPSSEQTRFWDAQWLGRLKCSQKVAENKEITGIPFDQPEIPYTALYLLGILRDVSNVDVDVIDLWEKGSHLVDLEKLRSLALNYEVFLFSPFTSNYTFAKNCIDTIKEINNKSIGIGG